MSSQRSLYYQLLKIHEGREQNPIFKPENENVLLDLYTLFK